MDEKLRKILIGALIAVVGALLTYATDAIVPFLKDHPTWGPIAAGALAILVNAVRKWMTPSEGQVNG
jgi:hypothetical protein